MKRIMIMFMAWMLLAGVNVSFPLPLQAAGNETLFGALGAKGDLNPSLEKMLTYAIQDEYLARAEYEGVMKKFGRVTPFDNIIKAEETHIEWLKALFKAQQLNLPPDQAASHVVVPSTFHEALETGVKAEVDNIAMYESFLKKDLPKDVRAVFTRLRDASKNHLAAFEKNLKRGK